MAYAALLLKEGDDGDWDMGLAKVKVTGSLTSSLGELAPYWSGFSRGVEERK